jgi:ribosomal protein L7/L12
VSARHKKPFALPLEAHLALQDGDVITAIKLVREKEGLDLLQAKLRIDEAIAADPRLQERTASARREQRKRWIGWVLLFDALVIGAVVYWFFFR